MHAVLVVLAVASALVIIGTLVPIIVRVLTWLIFLMAVVILYGLATDEIHVEGCRLKDGSVHVLVLSKEDHQPCEKVDVPNR